MAGVREIKGRIKSVRNIQQITKAMKMVAAARIKKVETRMKAARPFAYKMQEVVGELTSQLEGALDPLMEARPVKRVAVLVVSADKGLCGSYNNNVVKAAMQALKGHVEAGREVVVIPVGSKGYRFFLRRPYPIENVMTGWNPDFDTARALADTLTEMFTSGKVDEVHVVYTRVISALTQEAKTDRLLPLASEKTPEHVLPYMFEPDPNAALSAILPQYLRTIFYQILLEARTSELSARLRAMTNATDNADKFVGTLTLDFFRARQSAITNEILEVASGAEALKK
ncbi:MAG: ATP synthase F1 subunit gamma [Proteobacteria bacterium]|nr:ATP synthase F1 subunit gamma [Pseudomonadota bacterium]